VARCNVHQCGKRARGKRSGIGDQTEHSPFATFVSEVFALRLKLNSCKPFVCGLRAFANGADQEAEFDTAIPPKPGAPGRAVFVCPGKERAARNSSHRTTVLAKCVESHWGSLNSCGAAKATPCYRAGLRVLRGAHRFPPLAFSIHQYYSYM
jgi:hypothetical protein